MATPESQINAMTPPEDVSLTDNSLTGNGGYSSGAVTTVQRGARNIMGADGNCFDAWEECEEVPNAHDRDGKPAYAYHGTLSMQRDNAVPAAEDGPGVQRLPDSLGVPEKNDLDQILIYPGEALEAKGGRSAQNVGNP